MSGRCDIIVIIIIEESFRWLDMIALRRERSTLLHVVVVIVLLLQLGSPGVPAVVQRRSDEL